MNMLISIHINVIEILRVYILFAKINIYNLKKLFYALIYNLYD